MTSLQVRNLVKRSDHIQSLIGLERIYQYSNPSESFISLVNEVSEKCQQTVNDVNNIIDRKNKNIVDLPIRSRRAFQWIAYLTETENLVIHLDAMQRFILYLPEFISKSWFGKIDLYFYHQGPLYRISSKDKELHVIIHEAFTGAPDSVLIAFLEIISSSSKSPASKLIREYAYSNEFQKARTKL